MKNSSSSFHHSQAHPLQSSNSMMSSPHSPPHPFASATHSKNRQPLHLIPILLGIMPYLMSTFFGHSQVWMEISFLLLILLWLYLSLKMPWEIYYCIMAKIDSYHHRKQQYYPTFSSSSASGDTTPTTDSLSSPPLSSFTTMASEHLHPYLAFLILLYYKALEIGAVILVFVSPFVSVYGITSFQNYYSEYQPIHFLSSFNIHLFLLAALIPSLKHFFGSTSTNTNASSSRTYGNSLHAYDESQRHLAYGQEKKLSVTTSHATATSSESAPVWAKSLASRMNRLETLMIQEGPKYAAIEGRHSAGLVKPAGGKLSSSLAEDADVVLRDTMSKRFANIEKNYSSYPSSSSARATNDSFNPLMLQKQALLAEQFNVLKYLWHCILRSLWQLFLITTWPCWLPVKITLKLARRVMHDLFSRNDGLS